MPTLTGPEDFLRYYERLERYDPDNDHWHHGAEMCRWWLSMIASGTTRQEVDEFLARLEAESDFGSGWRELRWRFGEWARSQGFFPKLEPRKNPRAEW